MVMVTKISGITLGVTSMSRSLRFYRDILGLKILYGDESSSFCSFDVGGSYLNLQLSTEVGTRWGRVIFYCDDVDGLHSRLVSSGCDCSSPSDAPWGERYFHLNDLDGHELSFAKPLHPKRE